VPRIGLTASLTAPTVFVSLPNSASGRDAATPLALLAAWPTPSLLSPHGRLEAALRRAWAAADASSGALQVITSLEELDLFATQRSLCALSNDCRFAAALLAAEGAEALPPHLGAADAAQWLLVLGVRSLCLRHVKPTAAERGGLGLSEFGEALLRRLQASGVLIDLSHSPEETVRAALAIAVKPMMLSHAVPASHARECVNRGGRLGAVHGAASPPVAVVGDELLDAIVAAGGVVGVSFAACVLPQGAQKDAPSALDDIAARVAAAVARLGAGSVALGSDWGGGVVLPAALAFPAQARAALWASLRGRGLSEEQAADVFGGSTLRLLRETLPGADELPAAARVGAAARRRVQEGEGGQTYEVWV
jgi:microsomal dipeptidase-like Zn-dependent dipeptidase